ncbi:transketolase C-terminal domain-containing protein [Halochromatium salexigens]|nr:transketolase C-terminal domain-containing protein [Halochromatium salexigens]
MKRPTRFLLSKGHAAPILWAALSEAGAIETDPLTLRQLDSDLEGHPTPRNPWSAEPTAATIAQVASERAQEASSLPLKVEYALGEQVATRAAFGSALQKLGSRFADLVVLDGDVKNSTKTELFAKTFPERFIEAQIAEQNMLSASGKRPCVATFAAFLTRAHDIIRMATHSQQRRMLICGSHAGISIGEDGPSQMGLEDMAMFRALNGTTVLYPADAVSAERLTEAGLEHDGIVYLRTTRGKTPVLYQSDERFEIGGSKTLAESTEDRLMLVAAGITVHTALEASTRLREQGMCTRVIDAYSVKPLDVATLQRAAEETGTLLVIEDHNRDGGLGDPACCCSF